MSAPSAAPPRPRAPSGLATILTAALLLPTAGHALLGLTSRMTADTYCHAEVTLALGLWGSVRHFYQTWSGRYTHYVLENLSALAAPRIIPLIVPAALALWLAALAALVWPLPGLSRARRVLLAALALAATLSGMSNPGLSLYWTDGLHNYVAPLVLFTGVGALAAQRAARPAGGRREPLWLAAAFGLAFLAAASTEMVGVLQLAALGLAGGLLLAFGPPALRRRVLPLLGAALAGALTGFLIVAAAPGNQVRLADRPLGLSPLALAETVVAATLICAAIVLKAAHLFLVVAVAVPAVLAATAQPHRVVTRRLAWALLLGIPAGTAALIAAALLPAVYGLGGLPPSRAIVVVAFVLVAGLMAWGGALGLVVGERLRAAPAAAPARRWLVTGAAAVCLVAAAEAAVVVAPLPRFAAYAAAWDSNYALIQAAVAAGAAEVVVPPIDNPTGLPDIGSDADGDVTGCMARLYGLRVVPASLLPPAN